tara:strand:+ start:36970 stop:37239 length:270 start_codon:yes stop_codon:yes gene_type:complete
MKPLILKRKIILFLILSLPILCFAEKSSTTPINFVDNICDRYEIIAGESYCVKESNITLNSCGKKSDWPCMEASGCLDINHFVLNIIDE